MGLRTSSGDMRTEASSCLSGSEVMGRLDSTWLEHIDFAVVVDVRAAETHPAFLLISYHESKSLWRSGSLASLQECSTSTAADVQSHCCMYLQCRSGKAILVLVAKVCNFLKCRMFL